MQTNLPTRTISEIFNGIQRQRQIIDIMPGKARMMKLGYTNILVDDSRIEALESKVDAMVQLQLRGDSPSANLENCTEDAHMPPIAEGDATMATKRLRVCVGHNDDGSPIIKQISGNSDFELADKAVTAILSSERRPEFIQDTGSATSIHTVPTFGDYTEQWLQIY